MPASRCSVRVLLLLLLFPIAISVNAQSKPGTATVSGRVLVQGEPLRDVLVGLQAPQPAGMPVSDALRARTDAAGRYRIANVPAGRYMLVAAAPGYASPGAGDIGPRGRAVQVGDGEQVESIDLELKRGGVVTGRVTDANGRPVVEERVALSRVASSGPAVRLSEMDLGGGFEMFLTDDQGAYRIYGLPPGKYLLSAGSSVRPGLLNGARGAKVYPLTYFPDAPSEAEAKPIEVTEGSETTGVDISFPEDKKTYSILGRVTDAESGEPVPNAEIFTGTPTPDGARLGMWGRSGFRTNAAGEFQLSGALPGKYGLFLGNQLASNVGEGSNEFVCEPVMIEVRDGDVSGVEIRARRGASIGGTIAFEGVVAPELRARLSQTFFRVMSSDRSAAGKMMVPTDASFRANADGSFRVGGLADGRVEIQLMGGNGGLSIQRIESGGAPVQGALDLKLGAALTGLRIVLAQGDLKVRGEVRIVGGTLPPELRIYASARRPGDASSINVFSSEVDARGQFQIEHLTAGEYEISVQPVFTMLSRPDSKLLAAFRTARQKVVVGNGGTPPLAFTIDLAPKEGNR